MLKKSVSISIFLLLSGLILATQQESFEFGKRMYSDGFYREAMLVFERIVSTAPQTSEGEEALFLLGEIHRNQENFDTAEDYYRKLYERFPDGSFREKALYNWAFSAHQQEKYVLAIDIFENFIETFPESLHRSDAIYYLIECFEQISAYNQVLSSGQRFTREYSTDHRVPEVLYLMGISYLRTGRWNDADNIFNMIIRDYQHSESRWKAVITQGEIIREEQGIQPALDHYNSQIGLTIPRQYEERIHREIAELYLATEQYDKAAQTLQTLIEKFDRSEHLAKYLNLYALSMLELDNYQPIITSIQRIDIREIEGTPYFFDYLLKVAQAFYHMNHYGETEALIRDISGHVTEDDHVFGVLYWQARLKEHSGDLLASINDYRHLMNTYPLQAANDELLMRIGDIYFEKLQMYSLAINYYNQVVTSTGLMSDLYWRALYRSALCHEVLGDNSAALAALRQINIEVIANESDREEILTRLEIISQHKSIDNERINERLITSLYDYILSNDSDRLREQLIQTMLFDMKDINGVIALLENDDSPSGIYMKGKAYLKALARAELEKRGEIRRKYLDEVNRQIRRLDSDSHPSYITELEIERDYIVNGYILSTAELRKAESFLSDYPQASAVNRFNLLVGYQHLTNAEYDSADQYLSKVTKDSEIPLLQYEDALIKMGNHFFVNEQYDRVIMYFDKLETALTINRPEELYRYSVALIETGETAKGLSSLEFLVRNATGYPSQAEAIELLAEHNRALENYHDVVTFMVLYPESKRDKNYYLQLSDDYLMLNDKNRAKESLMAITDKDNQVLFRLANLHYQTEDYVLAELTYSRLLQETTNKPDGLLARTRMGHILFQQENWREALTHYETVLTDLDERIDPEKYDYLDLKELGKNATIAYYRTQNRPRADNVKQRFQRVLQTDQNTQAEIELNESIYLMNVNRSHAERGFTDIINNRNLAQSLRTEAYFWRGLNHLENKKVNEAKSDFQSVLQSNERDLRNQAHLKLGTINFSQEQYQQALEHYYTVIEHDMTGSLAFDAAKNFAIVCKTIEEWQRAIEAYELILERWGDEGLEGETFFNIAYCQYRDRRYVDAINSFNKALPSLNDREMKAEAQYWIGESYFSMGQYDNAATEYLKVGYFYPEFKQWNAISELKLAESYIRQGRVDNARNILESIISKYGQNSDWSNQAQRILDQI